MARPRSFDEPAALMAAMELFWEQGYAATSMEQLTRAMGISRQSLYDTFGDKHQLFMAALDAYCAALEKELLEPLKRPGAGLAALHEAGLGIIDFLIRYPKRRACLMANTALELAPHDKPVALKVRAHMANMEAAFRAVLENAKARGEIAPQADCASLARYFTGMAQGLMVLAKSGAGRETLEEIANTAAGVLH